MHRLPLRLTACFNPWVHRGALQGGWAILCLGCSNVLGADFDPESVDAWQLRVTLPEHPADAQSPVPFTGSGRVVSDDEQIDCGSECDAAYPLDLGVRWHAATQGDGDQTFEFLAVDDYDRTYVLGTTKGSMLIGSHATESDDEVDVVLTLFDANGSSMVVENVGGETPLALSTLHDSEEILVAGAPVGTKGIFENCPPAKFANVHYVARVDLLGGTCSDLIAFPSAFSLVRLLVTGDNRVLVIGNLHDGAIDFDASDPKAHVEAGEEGAYLVVWLGSHLEWLPGESWIQQVKGASKLGASDVGREILLSLSANTDTYVGDALVPYQSTRGLIFVALGLDGQMLWHRSFGEVNGAAASQISWHEPSFTWFLAAVSQVEQPLLLDLENVTQSPIPLEGRQAIFGRFAP